MKVRLYLDTRSGSAPYPVRLGISKRGQTAFITLSARLSPEQWDAENQCVRRLPLSRFPQGPTIANYLTRRRSEIEAQLLRMEADGLLVHLTATQIRDRLLQDESADAPHLLADAFRQTAESKNNPRTRELYQITWRRIQSLCPDAERLTLEDITPEWLKRFNRDMEQQGTPKQNARNVHLRNLRHVLNDAANNDLTDNNPFRHYKLRYEETEKKALSLDNLRRLITVSCTGFQREYRDIFLLSFCLIGINIEDLCDLRPENLSDGRLHYRRAKTGHLYDIKVEPEALALINQYRGQDWLLRIRDRYRSARDYTQHINAGLKRLIPEHPFTELSTNWARHTWATIARNHLRSKTDDISASLGHKYGSRITAVYIDPDLLAVDELNRRMLDLVFSENTAL